MASSSTEEVLEPQVLPADAVVPTRPTALPSGAQVGAVSGAALGLALAGKGKGLLGAVLGGLAGALLGAVVEGIAQASTAPNRQPELPAPEKLDPSAATETSATPEGRA